MVSSDFEVADMMLEDFLGVLVGRGAEQIFLGTPLSLKPILWSWVTEGQASKGPWGPFCHMLFFRKKVVKDRQIKKSHKRRTWIQRDCP